MIIPGSQAVYLDALRQGWIELFTLAGAAVSVSTSTSARIAFMASLWRKPKR